MKTDPFQCQTCGVRSGGPGGVNGWIGLLVICAVLIFVCASFIEPSGWVLAYGFVSMMFGRYMVQFENAVDRRDWPEVKSDT